MSLEQKARRKVREAMRAWDLGANIYLKVLPLKKLEENMDETGLSAYTYCGNTNLGNYVQSQNLSMPGNDV